MRLPKGWRMGLLRCSWIVGHFRKLDAVDRKYLLERLLDLHQQMSANANLERSERRGDTLRDFVRPAFPGNVMGGRGVCRHCGEAVNNVAYHESNACKQRPNTEYRVRT